MPQALDSDLGRRSSDLRPRDRTLRYGFAESLGLRGRDYRRKGASGKRGAVSQEFGTGSRSNFRNIFGSDRTDGGRRTDYRETDQRRVFWRKRTREETRNSDPRTSRSARGAPSRS